MHRIGIVIGTVVIMLIGIGIVSGQSPPNETSTPTAIETPTATPTPTVKDLVCEQLSFAVIDAYVALITLPSTDGDEAITALNASKGRIKTRLGYILSITGEEPLLYRLTWPLYTLYGISSANIDPFEMIATSRQLNRLCIMDGYPEGFTGDLDILTEYGCSSHGMVRNEKPAIGLLSGGYPPRCTQAEVGHNHDWEYAEFDHDHYRGY